MERATDEQGESQQTAGERAVAERSRNPNASHLEKSLAMAQGLAEGFAEEARRGDLAGSVGAAAQQAQQTVQEAQQGLRRGMPPSEGPSAIGASGGSLSQVMERGAEAASGSADTLALLAQQIREAPTAIAAEVRATVNEVMGEARKTLIGGIAAVILGLFGLFLLSYGAAIYLDGVWGTPWGFVAVGGAYFIVAMIAAASARSGAAGMRREAEQGMERVKGEVAERTAVVQGRRGSI